MSAIPASAPLVSAIRSAKDAYFAGCDLTIHEMTVLRIYFKRILYSKRSAPGVSLLRRQGLEQARSVGIYAFGKAPRN